MVEYFKKSGIEKSCSGLSLSFYLFLLQHQTIVNTVINRIIQNREICKNNCAHPVFDSHTNFITLDFSNINAAEEYVSSLEKRGIIVKNLSWSGMKTSWVRITISEDLDLMKRIIPCHEAGKFAKVE